MRKLQGIVVSDTMQRTAVVRVDRLTRHPKYRKYYRVSRKFKADTADVACRTGDLVTIQETRPLSKEKRWKVVELLKRAVSEKEEKEDSGEENQEAKSKNS